MSSLVGHWVNTNSPVAGFCEVELSQRDGLLEMRACAASPPFAGDWGRVTADTIYANDVRSQGAVAFTASYDLGFAECLVQGNQSLGLLIIAQLCRFTDGSGRRNIFTREFYRCAEESEITNGPALPDGSRLKSSLSTNDALRPTMPPDASAFVGTWVNTHAATTGMARLEIGERDGHLWTRIHGADPNLPRDWGETRVATYASGADSDTLASFTGTHDLGAIETRLHTWVKQGVLVAARFDRFKDGSGRSNKFSREFFYRID